MSVMRSAGNILKTRLLPSKFLAQLDLDTVFGYVPNCGQPSPHNSSRHLLHPTYVKYAQCPVKAQQSCRVHLTWQPLFASQSNSMPTWTW